MLKTTATIILLASAIVAFAQKKELTNDQYFKSNFKGITQPIPFVGEWLNDNEITYSKDSKKYVFNLKTKTATEYVSPAVNKGEVNTKPIVITKGNDLYVRKNTDDVQITFDASKETNPIVSPDGNYVAYTKNNNLYTVDLNTSKENKLTNDGSDVILNGYLSWVYMEEILGRSSNYRGFWWSPDSKNIAYFRSDDTKVPEFVITDATGQHGLVEKQRYPKSGDANPSVKVGFVSPSGGATTWAAFNEQDDQYFGQPNWTPDGKNLWVNWMNRGNNNLIIYAVNPNTGAKTEIYNETQKTWIDLDDNDRIQFLNDNKGFLLLSDKTGWKHIYHYDLNGKLVNTVTQGKYTVLGIERIDYKKQLLYFIARSKENTATRDMYSVGFNGKNLKRLTAGNYMHTPSLSPNGKNIVTTYSNSTTPTALGFVDVKTNKVVEIASSKTADFDNYNLAKTELLRIKSDDGLYDLPLKITWPLNYDKNKKYPVLISIYGGPDAGTVWDTWSLTGNQQWYAKEGLIQVAMDHRASGHFGKEGVNYMHRNLGYWEMVDYTTMVKWLIANAAVDPAKVCITGFSYGGYMSCYALTHSSDVFKYGMAGGSVTDWHLYDSHYTEKLMDTPNENPEGYKTSSVLTYVDKYKGGLQLVHGAIDDNVHQQNSIQLLSKLQDAKKDVEFMSYSGGRHGWGGAKGAHFTNLKTKFIYKYLLEKEVPKELLR
jgi:dipeptidyl-peptidase 4